MRALKHTFMNRKYLLRIWCWQNGVFAQCAHQVKQTGVTHSACCSGRGVLMRVHLIKAHNCNQTVCMHAAYDCITALYMPALTLFTKVSSEAPQMSSDMYIHTYIHAYIHTYIHTYIQSFIYTTMCTHRQPLSLGWMISIRNCEFEHDVSNQCHVSYLPFSLFNYHFIFFTCLTVCMSVIPHPVSSSFIPLLISPLFYSPIHFSGVQTSFLLGLS